MSKDAIVRPDDLHQFAVSLHSFCDELRGSMGVLQAGFDNLGETWRDHEHAQFAEIFAETARTLDRFLQAADEQIPFLHRKAEAAQAYLDQR